MQDPARLYHLETDTSLVAATASAMVVALGGYLDAGHTQRLLTEHLLRSLDHTVVATFDVDQLIDYRSRRPIMTFERDHWRDYADPTLALYRLVDAEGTPFLLLAGPEPDFQWERVVEAVRGLMRALGVTLSVTVHGIPMAVPHTRPIGASVHATNERLRTGDGPVFGTVSLPGSLAGLLEFRLGEAGADAVGYAIHVPHYLAQSEYPAGALAGLQRLAGVTGLHLPDAALRLAVTESARAIDRELAESAEAAEVVATLERQFDARHAASSPGSGEADAIAEADLPTADQLGAELEAFLRDVGRGGHPPR